MTVQVLATDAFSLVVDVFSILTGIFAGIIAFLALRFAATPKINVTFLGEAETGRTHFAPGEQVGLRFQIENAGRIYAKPAARNLRLFVNFDPAFELERLHFGSAQERSTDKVRRGVKDSKYLVAKEIQLFYNEPGEDIVVELTMPSEAGTYSTWIAAESETADHGVYEFNVRVG